MISAPNLSLSWGICVCRTKMRSLWSNISGHLDLPTNLRKWKASYWLQWALAAKGCSCVVLIQNIPLVDLRWWHPRLWAALEGINLHTRYNKTRSTWHPRMTACLHVQSCSGGGPWCFREKPICSAQCSSTAGPISALSVEERSCTGGLSAWWSGNQLVQQEDRTESQTATAWPQFKSAFTVWIIAIFCPWRGQLKFAPLCFFRWFLFWSKPTRPTDVVQ